MRKLETTVYQFDELSDDAKQKAIDQYREGQDFPWLSDDLANELEEMLKQNKITYKFTPNVYYSLSYSQGDGAMFEGTVFWKSYTVTIKHSGHYYHENSKDFEMESTKTGNDAKPEAYAQFNEMYVDICKKLAAYGYDLVESETSDENISRYLSEMEYEFTEAGEMI